MRLDQLSSVSGSAAVRTKAEQHEMMPMVKLPRWRSYSPVHRRGGADVTDDERPAADAEPVRRGLGG